MGSKFEIELGARIRALRERAHLSQADLAQLSLKSVETISNFERGKTLPSVRTLTSLARHLDCSVADFFKTTDRKKPERENALLAKLKMLSTRDRDLLNDFADLLVRRNRRQ